jgi:methionyl-tRNA formyltransferase
VNFYLKGDKGLAAAKALLDFPEVCNEVYLMKDPYTSSIEYEDVSSKLKLETFNVIELFSNAGLEYSATSLLVGWNRIVDPTDKDIFVIHDSILPKFRGWNPLVSALIEGESEIGATLFKANSGIDTGPIIRSERIRIPEYISIEAAMELLNPIITSLTEHLLKNAQSFDFNYLEQDDKIATFSLWRDETDYYLDFNKDSSHVLRHILASGKPYKGARAWLFNEEVIIREAKIVDDVFIANRTPGKVISIINGNPIVVCGSGLLEITNAEFLHGDVSFYPFNKIKSRFTRVKEN